MFKPTKRKMGHGADRKARQFQILTVLYERSAEVSAVEEAGLTMSKIAKKIGLVPSDHVRKILIEMLEAGWINARAMTQKNGINKVIWTWRDGTEWSEEWSSAFCAWYSEMQLPIPGLAS